MSASRQLDYMRTSGRECHAARRLINERDHELRAADRVGRRNDRRDDQGEHARILEQARSAAPLLAASPPTERGAWLYAMSEALERHVDELVEIADRETALGRQRLTAEVARAAGQLRFYADVAGEGSYLDVTIDDATVTSPRLVRINRPIGPVAVFGASNFPFAFGLLGNDTASAIAAGCPVIAKAHPCTCLAL